MSTKCITPYEVKGKYDKKHLVPCSKCPSCIRRRASSWTFRLMQEEKRSTSAKFVTLTYNTDKVPISPNGFMTLKKSDLQNFFKRLRKTSNEKIKYYAVGEYGENKERPHYHFIIFNAKEIDIYNAWILDSQKIGEIHFGTVNEASIGYTLKYMDKEKKIPKHQRDDRQKEFAIMSKGLGENYLTDNMVNWHKNDIDNRMYVNIEQNKKIAMPRYYKQRIYTDEQRKKIAWFNQEKYEQQEEKLKLELGENYNNVMAERHLQQFKKMHKNATKNKTL